MSPELAKGPTNSRTTLSRSELPPTRPKLRTQPSSERATPASTEITAESAAFLSPPPPPPKKLRSDLQARRAKSSDPPAPLATLSASGERRGLARGAPRRWFLRSLERKLGGWSFFMGRLDASTTADGRDGDREEIGSPYFLGVRVKASYNLDPGVLNFAVAGGLFPSAPLFRPPQTSMCKW